MADSKSLSSAIAPSLSQPLPPDITLVIGTVTLTLAAVLLVLILGAMIYRRRRARNGLLICFGPILRQDSLISKLVSDLQLKLFKNSDLAVSDMIEQIKVCVVVFSQDYAGSPESLDTLVKVHEWRKKTSRRVVPVFYNVDPSHVRELRGSYEVLLGDGSLQVQKWRHAVRDISALCGFNLIPEMANTSPSLMPPPSSVSADPCVEAV